MGLRQNYYLWLIVKNSAYYFGSVYLGRCYLSISSCLLGWMVKYLFIITSGIFFGFLHIFPTDLNIVYALINSIPYVTMGMVLAYIYKKEDNIYYPMILHGLNNFISMILFFCSWKNKKILYNRKKFWCYYERFIRKFNGVYLFT